VKPVDDYYLKKQTGKPRGRTCKECHKKAVAERVKRIADDLPALQRGYDLKRRYGITVAEYDRLLREQGGVCAICDGPPGQRAKYFHVDHCHVTGRVRGLLCRPCNKGLGAFRDRSEVIRSAITYVAGALDD
jgi:hypothetical protein